MVNPTYAGALMGLGLFLIILSPIVITAYTILTGTWGVLGAIIASIGTLMFINFYNIKSDTYRLVGLLMGPALVILGFYMMIRF